MPNWNNPCTLTGNIIEEGHLGGTAWGGDPSSWYPEIWDYLTEKYKIESVLDLGCGFGYSMEYFVHQLKLDALGVDGCEKCVKGHKFPDRILKHDLTQSPCFSGKQVDMVWCCEVLEHIEEKFLQNVLDTLYYHARKLVVVTAAPPGSPGYHHVNCQKPEYWIEKLSSHRLRYNAEETEKCKSMAEGELKNGRLVSYFQRGGLVFNVTYNYNASRYEMMKRIYATHT